MRAMVNLLLVWLLAASGSPALARHEGHGVTKHFLVATVNPSGWPQVVEEHSSPGTLTRTYTYGLDLVSQRQTPAGTVHWYLTDGLGTTRALFNSASAITDTYVYDAYGNLIGGSQPTPNLYRYTGEQWDPDLGMYYLRARYLNPALGRFWSYDTFDGHPTDPLSLHKYLYAHGNPVNNIDPSGYSDYSVIAQLAVSAFQKTLRTIKEVTPQLVRRRAKEFAKDFVEDKASEYLYILIIEPHMGPIFAYVGQSGALKERLEKHVKEFMAKYGDDVVVTVSHVIPFSPGDCSERTRKYIREGAEQLLLDTTRRVADDLGGTVGNVNNPVNLATAPARFRRHFKQGAKEWIRNLFTLTDRAG
jgi:RHS repeat-associated protein